MAQQRDNGPRFLSWWIAALSLVLPFIGAVLSLIGVSQLYRGGAHGWLLFAGLAAFILDVVIDFWLAYPASGDSDEPNLNARGRQLVGRCGVVVEAIENGRGKVRIGDTVWPAEGPDCPAGSEVLIIAAKGAILVITKPTLP